MKKPTLKKLAPNLTEVRLPRLTLWFSYETLVGFQTDEGAPVISHNYWGKTTGRHLNLLDGRTGRNKSGRYTQSEFEDAWTLQVEGPDPSSFEPPIFSEEGGAHEAF